MAVALLACGSVFAAASGTTVLVSGKARFEFLTPSLVRMEYTPTGTFVDAPTAVVQKRTWPAVTLHTTRENGWLVARTRAITLRYRVDSGPFTASNLEVRWTNPAGGTHAWHPGMKDPGNLGGLTYSLDNIRAANLPKDGKDLTSPVHDVIPGIDVLLPDAKPGLLSRSGFAYIDDSHTPLWNANHTWIEPRPDPHDEDGYLFVYNDDYRQVLREYAELCGAVPMIPRYTLGAWITDLNFEYFPDSYATRQPAFRDYGEQHLQHEILKFRKEHIPLDVLVLDFAWHNYGWQGGYDWSPLIPHPDHLLDWLHHEGIKVSLNDHPGYANTRESILSYHDSHAPAVLRALGKPLPPKPSFDLPIQGPWLFATDPNDQGLEQRWFASNHDDRTWTPILADRPWQVQGYPHYQGVAWYRTSMRVPQHLPSPLYLYLREVSQHYQLFVNGRRVPHSHVQWPRRLTYADVSKYLEAGQVNTVAIRVSSSGPEGGIVKGPASLVDLKPPPRIHFDLSNQQQADVFMRTLHQPLMRQGVNLWWVDGGGGAVDMPGLNEQLWTNHVFYRYTQQETGERGFILSRYGDWGSERYPAYFTGDTYAEWPVLAYEVAYTVRGGNVLVPYMSHDIGGFHGNKIPFDLYARWVEFGAFSPILRLHSAHENPRDGNARMPWTYGNRGMDLVRRYFTLRTQLIPYIYTYTRVAHTDSMPILRPLYLEDPKVPEAYQHPHEYFFGDQMLVAPVLDPGGVRTVYLPPGQWVDFFTGAAHAGGHSFTAHFAADQIPVFVRRGAIVPEQPADLAWSDAKPLNRVLLDVYGDGDGRFTLYEDDGLSMAYANGQYATTPMIHAATRAGGEQIEVGPTRGTFDGQVPTRAYTLRVYDARRPHAVSLDGKPLSAWRWDAKTSTLQVDVPAHSIRQALNVAWH